MHYRGCKFLLTIVYDVGDRYLNLVPIRCSLFRVVLEKTMCGILIILRDNVVISVCWEVEGFINEEATL